MECIETLKKELETLKQEKDVVDGKLAGLLKSSKGLENLIESQRSDKIKDGLGYSVVPPPIAQLYISPKKDLSWTGLPECADDIVTDYSRPSPTVETSKDLDSLLESQRLDKNKEELGYSVVHPPPAQLYSPPKKDLSWTGLPEFADDTETDYSRPSPAIKSTSGDVQNRNTSDTKTEASPSTISPKPFIKFVKAVNRPAERPTTNKVKTAKKPAVKYVELYRKPSKKPTIRGNQRNWNNLKSHQLGANFAITYCRKYPRRLSKNSSASETEASDSILSKHAVKFVKTAERPTTDKVET
nr:hypothetical protein [Tanacetum cinerariifolium]